MITTGEPRYSATKTEILDVVSGETCADLADFPLPNHEPVGANLNGTPVVCGGKNYPTYHQTCYKLTTSGWQIFASMKEKRAAAAGVIYQNKFHVFGGTSYDGISHITSQTSELISIDGEVEYGPELPDKVERHAITSINSSVSILIGGVTSVTGFSPLTWYFNHETNIFSDGPNLLEGRYEHASATCVDKVTKAKIPIVTGGNHFTNGQHGLDSTELLINEQWHSGTIQCSKNQHVLICFSAICPI